MDEKNIEKRDRVLEEDLEQVTGGANKPGLFGICAKCGKRANLYMYNGKGYCGMCFKPSSR